MSSRNTRSQIIAVSAMMPALFSCQSEALAASAAPAAPSSLTVSAGSSSQISLSWADNSSNEQGFVIQRSLSSSSGFSQVAQVDAGVVSYVDSGLSAGTSYYYRVAAYNKSRGAIQYSAFSNVASAATQSVAPSPSPSTSPSSSLWVHCANEGGTCTFSGSYIVRYGANGSYVQGVYTNSVGCNNTVFGDPAVGVAKSCDYYSIPVPAPSASPSPSPTASVSPLPAVSASPSPTATSGARNPLQQPFASNSIWNMPIGSGAQYVSAGLRPYPTGVMQWMQFPYSDDDVLILTPTAPVTQVQKSNGGWGGDRCVSTGTLLFSAPIPSSLVLPSNNGNMSSAVLAADGRTLIQSQPFARCAGSSFATSLFMAPNADLYGDGIKGAHGGSGMSSIGGTLRVGEMRPGDQGVHHALKLALYMKEAYKCTTASTCFRWPAVAADGYAVGWYGTGANNPNVNNSAMVMGALLAIPPSVDINSLGLETEPGRQFAWTLQNYGAYVVDDTYAAQFAIMTEVGSNGSFAAQFKSDFGMSFNDNLLNNTPWVRDLQRIMPVLSVVNNNSATSIGGGGTPRQPLAAPIAP